MLNNMPLGDCLLKVNALHSQQVEVVTASGCVANIPIVSMANWLPEIIAEHSRPLDPIEAAGVCVLHRFFTEE